MKEKIDRVLDTVKEPETGLTMAQLGFVERVRYNEEKKKLTVFSCNLKPNRKVCCTVMQGLTSSWRSSTARRPTSSWPISAVRTIIPNWPSKPSERRLQQGPGPGTATTLKFS